MALRRNKDTGAWERQQKDGTWSVVAEKGAAPPVGVQSSPAVGGQAAPPTATLVADEPDADGLDGLDAALQAAFSVDSPRAGLEPAGGSGNGHVPDAGGSPAADDAGPGVPAVADPVGQAQGVVEPAPQAEYLSADGGAQASPDGEDIVGDIPGLTSSDTGRSTSGSRGVRERLMARRGTGGREAGRRAQEPMVSVSERAARASGPAVRDGTESRARSRAQVGRGRSKGVIETKSQRYVTKPPPALLSERPRWVQDLFEAHFRSDLTLAMRKEFNRMKLSRQDYAIGWLTLLDKIKEDPAIVRVRGGRDLSSGESA